MTWAEFRVSIKLGSSSNTKYCSDIKKVILKNKRIIKPKDNILNSEKEDNHQYSKKYNYLHKYKNADICPYSPTTFTEPFIRFTFYS